MPKLTRWMLKTALVYLILALSLEGLQTAFSAWIPTFSTQGLRPVYIHLFMLGWVTQMIIGVAIWLFPPRSKHLPRGNEKLSWVGFWGLNMGLALRAAGEPFLGRANENEWFWQIILVISALIQVASLFVFMLQLWVRIKGAKGK